jgi:hypothetical protein
MHRWSLVQLQSVAAARGNQLFQRPPLEASLNEPHRTHSASLV